ncbi:MAG: hypothetical protein JWR18_4186 [Segetibacter sp.]|nr:hypothetical protein [Segetibacter sp.]
MTDKWSFYFRNEKSGGCLQELTTINIPPALIRGFITLSPILYQQERSIHFEVGGHGRSCW